jgi:hypothetical protein
VRDHDDRQPLLIQPLNHAHQFDGGATVEIPGGVVSELDRKAIGRCGRSDGGARLRLGRTMAREPGPRRYHFAAVYGLIGTALVLVVLITPGFTGVIR